MDQPAHELRPSFQVPLPRNPREQRLEEAFVHYVGMGEGRSLGALAREINVSTQEVIRHAKAFLWNQRLATLTSVASQRTMEHMVETISTVNQAHVKRLRRLQEKAFNFLENAVFDKPADAIRMFLEAVKLERDILGLTKGSNQDLAEVLSERVKQLHDKDGGQTEFTYDPDQRPEDFECETES